MNEITITEITPILIIRLSGKGVFSSRENIDFDLVNALFNLARLFGMSVELRIPTPCLFRDLRTLLSLTLPFESRRR